MTFLNFATALSLNSFTVMSSAASQGTNTRVSPKHTITFIANPGLNISKKINFLQTKGKTIEGTKGGYVNTLSNDAGSIMGSLGSHFNTKRYLVTFVDQCRSVVLPFLPSWKTLKIQFLYQNKAYTMQLSNIAVKHFGSDSWG